MLSHTIAAVSTPCGKGGIAVIRVSGDLSRDIISRVFVPAGRTAPADTPRRTVFGSIRSGERVIDRGVCVFFAAPASYTGEDVAEISCHGGVAVTSDVLAAVIAAGAELAGPGEFTHRAFINGKLTLSEAEAVGLLIDADTAERVELASAAASGALSDALRQISDKVTAALAELYAAIDYPDEDIGDVEPSAVAAALRGALKDADGLLSTFKRGNAIVDGVPCAIVGAPNTGKSSLYNAICGRDAAIVTDVAGTTRDVLSETVSFGSVTLLLRDTAGVRESADKVEQIGVARALDVAASSALVFFTYDLSRALTEDERGFAKRFAADHPGAVTLAVFNKSDLPRVMSEEDEMYLRSIHNAAATISAKSGVGLDGLAAAVAKMYDAADAETTGAVIWSAAQQGSLLRAAELLAQSADALDAAEPTDAACTLAESALESLMQIDGRGVSEEIVRSIFARFCVGK